MKVTSSAKLLAIIVSNVLLTVLASIGRIDGHEALIAISSTTAYLIGNGVAAMRGKESLPVLGRRPQLEEPGDQ